MVEKQLEAERRLAIALGWTNLVDVGGFLVGAPPCGGKNSRGQAAVPAWTRDCGLAFALQAEHNVRIWVWGQDQFVSGEIVDDLGNEISSVDFRIAGLGGKESAMCFAVAAAVEGKLKRLQGGNTA